MNFFMTHLSSFKYRHDQLETLGLIHVDSYRRGEVPRGYN